MPASNLGQLEIHAGEDIIIDVTITGADATTFTAIAFKITDDSKVATLNGGTAISKTLGSGITAPDATSILIVLDKADTTSLGCTLNYIELRITDSGSKEQVIGVGSIQISESQT